MNKNMIQLKKASKFYIDKNSKIELFDEVNFTLKEKQFASIQGASGVGKSTLLHILGLLDVLSEGEYLFMGQSITSLPQKKMSSFRKYDLGFMFQFHHLLADFTSLENVMMPLYIQGNISKQQKEFVDYLLNLVGMTHRLKHLPSELSGGERQRLALVRALVHRPKVLLADEPTGNLDKNNAEQLHQIFTNLSKELGIALILVTHDPSLAKLASVSYTMENKKLLKLK